MIPRTRSLRPLTGADLTGLQALSASAGWNQNEDDWRLLLQAGHGWGIESSSGLEHGRLVASATVVPYRPGAQSDSTRRFAWISMVLVLPDCRGQGLASSLLRHAIERLRADGITPVLDATPQGHPIYLGLGFEDSWGFRRYRRDPVSLDPQAIDLSGTRAIGAADWPTIRALDEAAFGADRSTLLTAFAGRMPQAARVAERDGRITGYVLARNGRDATQIGPLFAPDDETAIRLLDDALALLPGPVYVDLADRHLDLLKRLVARGFILQRPFTRMVMGSPRAPGKPDQLILMAGPEFG